MTKFDRCLAITLKHEGGWSDHPSDPGGATMKGVTIGTFAQFKGRKVSKDELRNISNADLRAIYRRKYWDKVRGDDLPPGLDLVAFDAAVNSGPARGVRWLQGAVNVAQDGKVGPVTIQAAKNMHGDGGAIDRACDARMAFLRGLKTWTTFGKGWTSRVEDIRAKATAMARESRQSVGPASLPQGQAAPVTSPKAGFFATVLTLLTRIFGGRK